MFLKDDFCGLVISLCKLMLKCLYVVNIIYILKNTYLISKSGSSGSPRVPSKVYKGKPRQIQALIPPELDVGGCVGCRGSVKFNFESINQNIQCLHYYHHTTYSMHLKQYKYFYKQTSQTIKCSRIGGRK